MCTCRRQAQPARMSCVNQHCHANAVLFCKHHPGLPLADLTQSKWSRTVSWYSTSHLLISWSVNALGAACCTPLTGPSGGLGAASTLENNASDATTSVKADQMCMLKKLYTSGIADHLLRSSYVDARADLCGSRWLQCLACMPEMHNECVLAKSNLALTRDRHVTRACARSLHHLATDCRHTSTCSRNQMTRID